MDDRDNAPLERQHLSYVHRGRLVRLCLNDHRDLYINTTFIYSRLAVRPSEGE